MFIGIIITIVVTFPIAVIWGFAIDRMQNDSEYKGHDFLDYNEDEE